MAKLMPIIQFCAALVEALTRGDGYRVVSTR